MQTFEVMSMVVAVVLMFAAVAVKVVTAQLVGYMRKQISAVAQTKAEALSRLKMVQNRKQVTEKNKAILRSKKNKLSKKIRRLKLEMEGMHREQEARRQRTESRKVE